MIGFIYAAYIRNLQSVNQLKDSQLKIAELNVKLWKDKALELERRTPEFIEKQLSERIKIREDEISRLAKDTKSQDEEIGLKNREVVALKASIEKTHQYRNSITVWDKEESDYIEIAETDLQETYIGSLCVDTANLMICDPWYLKMSAEMEQEELKIQSSMYRVINTGELFCLNTENDTFVADLLGIEEELTAAQMLTMGIIEKIEYSGSLPAIETSYIKGDMRDPEYKKIRHLSFVDGRLGAGISISLGGDGVYPVYIEYYKDEMQRIIINV